MIGTWPTACDDFVKATSEWVATFEQPILRIAFAGTLLAKSDSPLDAYRQLLGLLKTVQGDPARMRELVFRINWPVKSKVANGLLLNRITHWSVIQIQLQLMLLTGTETVMSGTPATHVVRLEFDHNTDAERTELFERHQLVPIYNELVALALDNAERGEVL